DELPTFNKLITFELSNSNVTSLNGINKFENLQNVELHYLNKLEEINNICSLTKLKTLRMENCKKVLINDDLACLTNLNELALINCGNIPSIKFIKNMNKLKKFIFPESIVLDGDISPCFGLEYVYFINKKHYSHKNNEFS
ncbi:hypothetical protein ACFCYN_25500, partial [Gottfriedia sp. NPDC056225]